MSPILRFSVGQLALALPLPTLATAFALISLFLRRPPTAERVGKTWPILVLVAFLPVVLMLTITFFDMSRPRFLPPQPQLPKVEILIENNSSARIININFEGGGVVWGFDALDPGSMNA